MTFTRPEFMWLMLTIPLAAALMWLSDRARVSRLTKHAGRLLLEATGSAVDRRIRTLKRVLELLSLALLILAVAGPSYGTELVPELDTGVDIMLVVDVSQSMLATDIKPSRLEAVRLSIEDLLSTLRGERVGLVAFSGTAYTQCPLTSDYSAFMLYVRDLSVESIPRGGTNLEQALSTAVQSLRGNEDRPRAIILMSDGENHEGDPIAGAELAASNGISIYTVGVGTPDGELIPVVDNYGRQTFLQSDDGRIVKSELDEALLKDIARIGGGTYSRATQTDLGLTEIYQEFISTLWDDADATTASTGVDQETGVRVRRAPVDRYYIPLLAAIMLLSCDLLIRERRRAA